MISKETVDALEKAFNIRITSHQPVKGGDIADSYALETPSGTLFVKMLEGPNAFEMLSAEADGLRALENSGALSVPAVHGCKQTHKGAALIMDFIPPSKGSRGSDENLGRGLALLHQSTHEAFGWSRDNFIGKLSQKNTRESDWSSFFARHRLKEQFDMAVHAGLMESRDTPSTDLMHERIEGLLPGVVPSLLHGDLWGGNYLISKNNIPYLIDPAVYYGHSEVDLAMSRLFGGFSPVFYDAYHEVRPPLPGIERRSLLYQLYYLLVHLNCFGSSYRSSVLQATNAIFGED